MTESKKVTHDLKRVKGGKDKSFMNRGSRNCLPNCNYEFQKIANNSEDDWTKKLVSADS